MGDVHTLRWNSWNVGHIAKHNVLPEEVEEACLGEHIEREGRNNTILLIGPTQKARMLAIVLVPEGEGTYYAISARPASRKERGIYQQERGGEQAA